MQSSFSKTFRARLETFGAGLAADPGVILTMSETDGMRVLVFLVESACQAQGSGALEMGRDFLGRLPRDWLCAHIESIVAAQLDLDDEYEFDRLLDVYEILEDGALISRLIERGLKSENPEVRLIAESMR